jgi:hypothetical protein
MDEQKLYVVNCGSNAIQKVVVPATGGVSIPVSVGPKSFASVTNQAVTGALPWYVVSEGARPPYNPATKVDKLPAMVAFAQDYYKEPSKQPGWPYLTAVAYPT